MENRVDLDRIADLPSPPIIVQTLYKQISDENASSGEVARTIETDQAFTARVLRLVNSPFYGFARKVVSVEEAITMLGLNTIQQLLLTTSLFSKFKKDAGGIDLNDFWKHSFGVGLLAKNLLPDADNDDRNNAFICGVLHDIGRLALAKIDIDSFIRLYFEGDDINDLEKESAYFGIDHQQIGGLLAKKWNFPESIQTAITLHHKPTSASKYKLLVSAVNIADIIAHALEIGNSGTFYVSNFFPEAWQMLDLSYEKLESILDSVLDEIGDLEQMLIEIAGDDDKS